MMLSIMRRRYSLLAKDEESVFKSSSWCWRDGVQLARCCGVIWREVWEEKATCTDLAVEGARVGDVFLGLVRIHWMDLVGVLGGQRTGGVYFRIAPRFVLSWNGE